MGNRGLPRLTGGIAKARREAYERPCKLDGKPAVGIVETLAGPQPVCSDHARVLRLRGWTIHYRDERAG